MSESNPTGTKVLSLKKYPNRRYYDMSRSRYVTLEEIFTLIQAGYEIHVTDSKTGEDITAKVLAQILLDLDPPKLCVFSVPLLHRLIRANEQLVTDFVDRYFNQAMSAFLDSQKAFESSVRQTMGLPSGSKAATSWMDLMLNPVLRGWAGPGAAPASAEPSVAPPPEPDDRVPAVETPPDGGSSESVRQEVDELKRLVIELRAQLASSGKKKPARASGGGRGKNGQRRSKP